MTETLTWSGLDPTLRDRVTNDFTQVPTTDDPDMAYLQYYDRQMVQTVSTVYDANNNAQRNVSNTRFDKTGRGTTVDSFLFGQALDWIKAHDPSEYNTLQYFNGLYKSNPKIDPAEHPEQPPAIPKVVTPSDPEAPFPTPAMIITPDSSDVLAIDSGYIKAVVSFGISGFEGIDASDDVISLSTDQSTDQTGAETTARMTVTLNNIHQRYAGVIVPHMTLVACHIIVVRNVIEGLNLTVVYNKYPVFFGRVAEVTLSDTEAVVTCGDETQQANAAATVDFAWYAGVPLIERTRNIVKATPNFDVDVMYAPDTEVPKYNLDGYVPSNQSAASAISVTTQSFMLDWIVPSDEPHRLLIKDSNYVKNKNVIMNLTEFVIEPGDNESIVGHCNVVTVSGDSQYEAGTQAGHTPSSISTYIKYRTPTTQQEYDNDPNNFTTSDGTSTDGTKIKTFTPNGVLQTAWESIGNYGLIESPIYRVPAKNQEQLHPYAISMLMVYNSKLNELIKLKVCDVIPMLFTYVQWDMITGWADDVTPIFTTITAQVARKRVNYDASNGVIVDLELRRKSPAQAEAGAAGEGSATYKVSSRLHTGGWFSLNPADWFTITPGSIADALIPHQDPGFDIFRQNEQTGAIEYMTVTPADKDAYINNGTQPQGYWPEWKPSTNNDGLTWTGGAKTDSTPGG